MSGPQIQYPLTYSTWGNEEISALHKVIDGGRFTMGENVKRFEAEFAKKFKVKHALMVSSGSTANLVGLAALFYKKKKPLKRGDEVIVPAISWATTYYPLQQYGLKLKFVDVELDSLNIDVSLLKKALTKRTRAVMAVSILGNPCALKTMRKFCDEHGLYLFEDNCESMGAEVDGRLCGTWGDIGTFSSFYSHHISTMEGGIIVTDDSELFELVTSLRAHGWTRDLPKESKIFKRKAEDFFEAYRFILPGYNARPLEMSGAVGLEQLKKLDAMVEQRRVNAKHFQKLFAGDERLIIQKENGKSSWFSFTMILNPKLKIDRARVMNELKNAGIEFRIITGGNFLRHDVIKYFDYSVVKKSKLNADIAHDRGFFVGNFPVDARSKIDHLHATLKKALR